MKQLRKSPNLKQLLHETIEISNQYTSISFNVALHMDLLEGKGYTVWGVDSVFILVPDKYRKAWDSEGKEEWDNLYRVITDVWNQSVRNENVNVHFIAVAIPNGAIQLKPIHPNSHTIEIKCDHINRGYTRYIHYENRIMNMDSVMFHPSARIGVVAFHELMHAIMFATGLHTEDHITTPWGAAPYSEIICEFYGNCMDAYACQTKTRRRSYLQERMKVYESQAMALVYLLEHREVQMESMNPVSYLCGTYFSLRKVLQQNRIQWNRLLEDPIQFLENPYMKPTSEDWRQLIRKSKQVHSTTIRFDRSDPIV